MVFDVPFDGWQPAWRAAPTLGREFDPLADVIFRSASPGNPRFRRRFDGGWGLGRTDLLRLLRRRPIGPASMSPPRSCLPAQGHTVAYFQRTPIPTSVVLTVVLAFAARGKVTSARTYQSVQWPRSVSAGVAVRRVGNDDDQSKTLRIPIPTESIRPKVCACAGTVRCARLQRVAGAIGDRAVHQHAFDTAAKALSAARTLRRP